jgi:hypothetical protein
MDGLEQREYRVDASGLVTSVDEGWDAFARANGGRQRVFRADIIGRPLVDLITGSTLKHLWETLMMYARERRQVIVVPFRCDAPEMRRSMQMRVEPGEDAGLCFTSKTMRQRRRARVPLLDALAPRSSARLLSMCSWCKRLHCDGEWLEVEEAVRRSGLLQEGALPDISHGLCPTCERDMVAQFRD